MTDTAKMLLMSIRRATDPLNVESIFILTKGKEMRFVREQVIDGDLKHYFHTRRRSALSEWIADFDSRCAEGEAEATFIDDSIHRYV